MGAGATNYFQDVRCAQKGMHFLDCPLPNGNPLPPGGFSVIDFTKGQNYDAQIIFTDGRWQITNFTGG
jgi:hypothetical protein